MRDSESYIADRNMYLHIATNTISAFKMRRSATKFGKIANHGHQLTDCRANFSGKKRDKWEITV